MGTILNGERKMDVDQFHDRIMQSKMSSRARDLESLRHENYKLKKDIQWILNNEEAVKKYKMKTVEAVYLEIRRLTEYKEGLIKDIDELKKEFGSVKYKRRSKKRRLGQRGVESYSRSVGKLNLKVLRELAGEDLIEIILLREVSINEMINDFDERIKGSDRAVFKILREENEKLNNYLIDKDVSYRELQELKEQFKTLREALRLTSAKLRRKEEELRSSYKWRDKDGI